MTTALERIRRRYACMFEGGGLDGALISVSFDGVGGEPAEVLHIALLGEDRPEDYGPEDGKLEVYQYNLMGFDSSAGIPTRTAHYKFARRTKVREGLTLKFGSEA